MSPFDKQIYNCVSPKRCRFLHLFGITLSTKEINYIGDFLPEEFYKACNYKKGKVVRSPMYVTMPVSNQQNCTTIKLVESANHYKT